MRQGYVPCAVCGLTLVGLALSSWYDWTRPEPGSLVERASRIRPGMSLREIRALMGAEDCGARSGGQGSAHWVQGETEVLVYFDFTFKRATRAAVRPLGGDASKVIGVVLFDEDAETLTQLARRWFAVAFGHRPPA